MEYIKDRIQMQAAYLVKLMSCSLPLRDTGLFLYQYFEHVDTLIIYV